MKKIIYGVGVIFLVIIVIINILLTAHLNEHENISIHWNGFSSVLGLAILGVLLYWGTKKLDSYFCSEEIASRKRKRKIVLIVVCTMYILLNILWVALVRIGVGADQVHVCNLAQTFYRGDLEEFLPGMTYAAIPLSEYVQGYTQQITLAFIFNICFKIFHTDLYVVVLRLINIACNCLTVYGLYKISSQIAYKYKTNRVLLFTLILTFFPLVMLSNFIYGDIPSLALCLFSIYFTMRYTQSKKWKYILLATFFMMIAYMMRMNNLIFIIATVIYLLLSMWKEIKQTTWKQKGMSLAVILIFVIISILPSTIVKNYYINKLGLDKTKTYPTISYFLMAMEEAPRGNGWYKEETGEYALKNPEKAREEYPDRIKERFTYLVENPRYTFQFYIDKIASMWAENTYSAVCSNISKENDPIQNFSKPLEFYQKAVLLVITICSLIVLVQNRKNLSLEVLFLLTIFIGGFAFHILWEAKSRYIIPYIIVLMPVASIEIKKFKMKL